jgi:hypothetical protein
VLHAGTTFRHFGNNFNGVYITFLTNTSNYVGTGTAGYVVYFYLDGQMAGGSNAYMSLRRCSTMGSPVGCGVLLTETRFNLTNDIMYNISGEAVLNKSIVLNITDSANGDITAYLDGVARLVYSDMIFSSGYTHFFFYAANANSLFKIDNISLSGIAAAAGPVGWELFSFPMNMADFIGIGSLSEVFEFIIQMPLEGTSYVADIWSTDFYDGGYPTDTKLKPYFVMKKNDAYFGSAAWVANPVRMEIVISSPHANKCFYKDSNGSSNVDIYAFSLYDTLGVIETYIYNPSIAGQGNQTYLDTNPWIVTFLSEGLDFWCTSPENLTAEIRIMNGSYSGLEFDRSYALPIGYAFSANGTPDYTSFIHPNQSVDYIVRHAPPGTEPEVTPDLVDILFSNEMIGLGVILICSILGFAMLGGVGAFASSIIGIYVVVQYNLLPAWLFVIVIVAVAALGANAARELITGH